MRWRLLDTGLASAARNVALSRALLEARSADEIPGTLRFVRYAPAALLACRQSPAQELDSTACAAENIAIQRRISGGAAWLVHERQLAWELYLHRRDVGRSDVRTLGRRIAHAAATALCALGAQARCRSNDEIEIEGRAVGAIGAAAEGDALLFQGLIFVDVEYERCLRLVRSPFAGAGEHALAEIRRRTAGLKDVLVRPPDSRTVKANLAEAFESEFDMELTEGDLILSEQARFDRAFAEVQTAGWNALVAADGSGMPLLTAIHALRSGTLRAVLKYERAARVIREVWFSGDVGLRPLRLVVDLEAALRDTPIERVARRIEWFFASHAVTWAAAAPADFAAVVQLAAGAPGGLAIVRAPGGR